ncbi:MAG: PEP-CTERM sorting domain-containing protein [Armatimonadetes bacterium]|nr:PEP-CTERM sorting domain-containing protein [Armatimonadota bacterium]
MAQMGMAQMLTARDTTMHYSGGYGQSLDWTPVVDDFLSTTLEASSSPALTLDGHKSGMYLQSPWYADLNALVSQSYAISGSMSNFDFISGALTSQFVCASDGPGSGSYASNSSGSNRLSLTFEVGAAGMNYSLSGHADWLSAGPNTPHAEVRIMKLTNGNWGNVWSSISLPNGSDFSHNGTLTEGTYMLDTNAQTSSLSNDTAYSHAIFTLDNLDVVPEPLSFVVLAIGALGLFRRRNTLS